MFVLFNLKRYWQRFINVILYFLSPEVCGICGQLVIKNSIICSGCCSKIDPLVSCSIDITPSIAMDVFSICSYKSSLQKMVLAKHWGDRLAAIQLGQLIWQRTTVPFLSVDCIVPIPLHWTRKAWRGFNQAEVIGNVIAQNHQVPLEDILQRVRRTQFHKNLSHDQRKANVKDVFKLKGNPETIKGKHILLVDDVMTSGSTLQQAARELVRYKPASIVAVVAMRVV